MNKQYSFIAGGLAARSVIVDFLKEQNSKVIPEVFKLHWVVGREYGINYFVKPVASF